MNWICDKEMMPFQPFLPAMDSIKEGCGFHKHMIGK